MTVPRTVLQQLKQHRLEEDLLSTLVNFAIFVLSSSHLQHINVVLARKHRITYFWISTIFQRVIVQLTPFEVVYIKTHIQQTKTNALYNLIYQIQYSQSTHHYLYF